MIQKTLDYDKFKTHPSNRPIDAFNLRKLINSIRMKNMLDIRPILVNSKMQVIDGQHRLEAAKQLGVEIFFIKQEEDKDSDMVILNNNQRQWKDVDYVNYYSSQGSIGHIKFKRFVEKNSINTSLAASILFRSHSSKKGSILKKEILEIRDEHLSEIQEELDKINAIIEFLSQKLVGKRTFFRRKAFFVGCSMLLRSEGIILDTFFKKLDSQLSRVHNCPSATEYFEMFKSIYNYRNPLPID